MLTILLIAATLAAPDPPIYSGRAGRLEVTIPRIEAKVEVDGRLDEPEWTRAARLTGFSGYLPAGGRAAADSTEVLLWYSPTALHVGVRAYEAHGAVHATLADRDRIDAEDHVQLLLDTFGDHRQAYVLAVNALGVQADGIRTENRAQLEPKVGMGNVDLSTDVLYQSKGRLTEWGYEVELRIPFRSLRYGGEMEGWGINVVRQVQHSGHQDSWAPVLRSDASFLAKSGTLRGLHDLRRGMSIDLNPVLTSTTTGRPGARGWEYETMPEIGANVRWGITPDLTMNATVNPDFSQVEADAGQVPGDSRYAVFFPEKRPFFVDGGELFDVPNRLVYTRRIVEPVAAAKMTGKVGGMEMALLSAADGRAQSADGERNPLFNVLRMRRGLGEGSTLGLLYTDRSEGSAFNRVGELDARLLLGSGTRLGLQAAGSATRAGGEMEYAPLWSATLSHTSRRWGAYYQLNGIHPDFTAATGFIDRTDQVGASAFHHLAYHGAPGARLESWRGRVLFMGTWLYEPFFRGDAPLETKLWVENTLTLRGGWNVMLTRMFETFAFDPREYADYRVVHPRAGGGADTVAFEVSPRQHTGVWYFVGDSPQFQHFSASGQVIYGLDPHFEETIATRRLDLGGSVRWVPDERLRLDASFAHSEFRRREDHSLAAVLDIPRLKVEYQLARPVFFRLVGEYYARAVDALRDPRSGDPIILAGGAGAFHPAARREQNDVRFDALFSYQPSPGTVVFVGYGTGLTEPDRLAMRDLRRTRDGLFVKLSYLFRR